MRSPLLSLFGSPTFFIGFSQKRDDQMVTTAVDCAGKTIKYGEKTMKRRYTKWDIIDILHEDRDAVVEALRRINETCGFGPGRDFVESLLGQMDNGRPALSDKQNSSAIDLLSRHGYPEYLARLANSKLD